MTLNDIDNLNLPKAPGSYQFYNKEGKIIYVGKAANLHSRVRSYWQKSTKHGPAKAMMMPEIARVAWEETDTEIEALLLEANLIKKHQPHYNVLLRDDKRFQYIKVSTEDEIPGVFTTRHIGKSGKYFGPFTKGLAVKETLKAIRKIWPYCNERKLKTKPCFYSQVGKCTGVCGGQYDIEEYKEKVIRPIVLFLSGKKKAVVRKSEVRSKKLESQKDLSPKEEEELRNIKYQLLNMRKVLEHAHILSVADKYAADVVELAKVLQLPRVPYRIEGYDISNIFGNQAVGSMVVFNEGESEKSEYRKFKIRIGQGQASDTGMLKEVIERRLHHDEWPLPDLMIIDGGKGQLNAALSVLKKRQCEVPVMAVSKGAGLRSAQAPDKIFFPGESKPLELPLASPALHIIKRVRDEAHRFAIKYHRELKGKRLFK